MRYNPVYKCRMCGKIFKDESMSGDASCMMPILSGIVINGHSHPKYGGTIALYTQHEHEDGTYGISDLQGFQKDTKHK